MSNNKNKISDIDKAYQEARKADGSRVWGVPNDPNNWFYRALKSEPEQQSKEQRLKAYRAEARRLVSLANKRIRRLEKNGLTDSPAYKALVKNGTVRFSVKGKDFNELQSMVSEMNRFINAKTSTVRGITKVVKNMAKTTNFKYDTVQELKTNIGKFFELASKIEQYLRSVHDVASAIGYQKIWKAINEYIESENIDLSDSEKSIDDLIETISDAIVEKETSVSMTDGSNSVTEEFKLLD